MDKISVSIILPCFNEEAYIGKVLDNILAQDYPSSEIEVFVCDGGSTDQTRSIIKQYELRHSFIQLLDNPEQFAPHGINLALKIAKGEFMFLFGAQTAYPNNYITKLKESAEALDADLVGGTLETKPSNESTIAIGIAEVLSHPMGFINATFRPAVDEVTAVDSVPFGCYKMSVFDKFGLFDEQLIRNQGKGMSKRILNGGGKIFLIPGVKIINYGSDTLETFWENNLKNGKCAFLTAKYTNSLKSLSLKHFLPFIFVIYLLSLFPAYLILSPPIFAIYALPILFYLASIFRASWSVSFKRRSWSILSPTCLAFTTLHLSYGLGTIIGLFMILSSNEVTPALIGDH